MKKVYVIMYRFVWKGDVTICPIKVYGKKSSANGFISKRGCANYVGAAKPYWIVEVDMV
jgi:hypothetical protein